MPFAIALINEIYLLFYNKVACSLEDAILNGRHCYIWIKREEENCKSSENLKWIY